MGLPASPSQAKFPIWTGLLFSLPLIAIQLWFVVKHKQAFERPHGPSARRYDRWSKTGPVHSKRGLPCAVAVRFQGCK